MLHLLGELGPFTWDICQTVRLLYCLLQVPSAGRWWHLGCHEKMVSVFWHLDQLNNIYFLSYLTGKLKNFCANLSVVVIRQNSSSCSPIKPQSCPKPCFCGTDGLQATSEIPWSSSKGVCISLQWWDNPNYGISSKITTHSQARTPHGIKGNPPAHQHPHKGQGMQSCV